MKTVHIAAIFAGLFAALAAVSAIQNRLSAAPQSVSSPTVAGINGPVKVCSGIQSGSWRDSISVPNTWTSEACKGFTQSVGTNTYQLGCANKNSISWGGLNGGTPAENSCGW